MTTPPSFADSVRERYLLERQLGQGGMATVYLARDLKYDRYVALKVLRSELAGSLGPERFLREIRLAVRLQHPHVLTVFDSGESGGRLWFTMPYVEGESLRERILRGKTAPALWVHPLDGAPAYKVFEFSDPDVRIDYPVWSPDGKWVLFDRASPRTGDIWMLEKR